MGDRYTITASGDKLRELFDKDLSDRYTPRYNAAPTQVLPVITQGSEGFSFFYWGQLPERSKNKPVGNKLLYVSAETLTSTSTGKSLLQTGRCIAPADSFYAWKQISRKGRIAHRVLQEDETVFPMAAIWEEFEDDEGHIVHTFRIITRPAEGSIGEVTSFIPFILNDEDVESWLDSSSDEVKIADLLENPSAKSFHYYTVSPQIDNPANDSASLIRPFSPADQFGNYSLFD